MLFVSPTPSNTTQLPGDSDRLVKQHRYLAIYSIVRSFRTDKAYQQHGWYPTIQRLQDLSEEEDQGKNPICWSAFLLPADIFHLCPQCDERKPSCGQCRKGVRECEGYGQPTIFRNSTSGDFVDAPDSHCQSVAQFNSQSAGNITWVDHHEVRNDNQMAPHQKRPKKRVHPYARARLKRAQAQLSRTAPLAHTPNPLVLAVQNITGQFLELCLPLSENQEAPLAWLGEIQEMGQDVDALPLAMSALALGWAGHANDQPQLAGTGLQLYNAAIRQLRDDMGTYSPLQSFVVTTIFVAFELCQFGSTGNPGWLTHMKGIAAFLQALGPEKVSMDPYLKIFSFCRIIFVSINRTLICLSFEV